MKPSWCFIFAITAALCPQLVNELSCWALIHLLNSPPPQNLPKWSLPVTQEHVKARVIVPLLRSLTTLSRVTMHKCRVCGQLWSYYRGQDSLKFKGHTFSTIQRGWDSTRSSVADEHKDYGDHGTQFALQHQENWHCPLEVSCKAEECVTYRKQQNLSSFPSAEEADISLSTGSMCSIWTLITLLIFPLPSIFAPSNTNVGVCSSSALLSSAYTSAEQGTRSRVAQKGFP